MNTYAVVLAAGKGTRMKSLLDYKSKVSYEILGIPLVKHVIRALQPLNVDKMVVIAGFGGETTTKICKDYAEIVWQHEQKGTGHAVMQAAPVLEGKEGSTLILCGDTPLLTTKTLKSLLDEHVEKNNKLTILSAKVPNPFGYGRIIRNADGSVNRIVEQSDTDEITNKVDEVNTGVLIFDNKLLFSYLSKLTPNNKKGEYYLTDLIKMFQDDGLKVGAHIMEDYREMLGINDRVQLAEAARVMKERINKELMLSGVTIEDPNNTYISPECVVEQDTVIHPNTHLLGKCHIGKCNELGPNVVLKDVTTKDNEVIK